MSGPPVNITNHAAVIGAYLQTLPAATPAGTFTGGIILRINADHYIGVCLPPIEDTRTQLSNHIADRFSGDGWEVAGTETLGDDDLLEAVHITRTFGLPKPAPATISTADEFFTTASAFSKACLRDNIVLVSQNSKHDTPDRDGGRA